MSITIEITGQRARVLDTDLGVPAELLIALSVGVTKWTRKRLSVPTATVDQAVQFDGIAAGKVLIIKTDDAGKITAKVNGGSESLPIRPLLIMTDNTAAGITAATISNASGATVLVDVIVGGST